MADKKLESIIWPDLPDRYVVKPDIADVTGLQTALDGKASKTDVYSSFATDTAQGSIASFEDGADGIPVKSLVAEIVPIQSGSGDPSPDNVRAISGWNSVDVNVSGVNVFDISNADLSQGSYQYPSSGDTEYVVMNEYLRVRPNTAYYFKNDITTSGFFIRFYDGNKTQIDSFAKYNVAEFEFTTPVGASYMRIEWYKVGGVSVAQVESAKVSINYPSTDTSYHAYHGSTVTIPLGNTYYGGVLDVVSGVLTVTDANIASYNGEALPSTWISDRDVYASGTTPTTGAQVVYKLATPQTYQLTPTEVKTLLGNNNIWANTGDIDLTYRADLGLYLDKIINA